jgi:hypothetical protein
MSISLQNKKKYLLKLHFYKKNYLLLIKKLNQDKIQHSNNKIQYSDNIIQHSNNIIQHSNNIIQHSNNIIQHSNNK